MQSAILCPLISSSRLKGAGESHLHLWSEFITRLDVLWQLRVSHQCILLVSSLSCKNSNFLGLSQKNVQIIPSNPVLLLFPFLPFFRLLPVFSPQMWLPAGLLAPLAVAFLKTVSVSQDGCCTFGEEAANWLKLNYSRAWLQTCLLHLKHSFFWVLFFFRKKI